MPDTDRQAGAEIEVTQDMIEAGLEELYKVSYKSGNEEELVAAIYRGLFF